MNLLIVENEPAVRAGIIRLCEREKTLRVVGEAGTGAKGLEAAVTLRPDLLLLDADLPDMSGFEVLRELQRVHEQRTVLLIPSGRHASSAFAAGAVDFLLKPVTEEAFSTSILRAAARDTAYCVAARRLPSPAKRDALRDANWPSLLIGEREHRLYPLDPFQIDFVRSAGNYVTYHVGRFEYIARDSIKRLGSALAPAGFVQIERSLLLNIRAIAYAEPGGRGSFAFTLFSGVRLRSGHVYRNAILAALPLRRRVP
jgi:two-component system LytT family response regulator